jgi:hypothetical protein
MTATPLPPAGETLTGDCGLAASVAAPRNVETTTTLPAPAGETIGERR